MNPHIGYEVQTRVAKEAIATGQSVRELCVKNGVLSQEDLELILDPFEMTHPGIAGAIFKEKLKKRGQVPPLCLQYREIISKYTVAFNGS